MKSVIYLTNTKNKMTEVETNSIAETFKQAFASNKAGEFETTVFDLIKQKSLGELITFINTHQSPDRWHFPYISMYSSAIKTGDDDFASELINTVSLECDYESGWADLWHKIASTSLELNMPKTFTALCDRMKICKNELELLKDDLKSHMNKYADLINSVKVSLDHECDEWCGNH